jgi:endosialidase-like protein
MTTLRIEKSINRSPLWRGLPVIALMLACFALSPAPKAFGVTPAPDGGYSGQSTAEGTDALFSYVCSSLQPCSDTALGFEALYSTVNGAGNTGVGSLALRSTTANGNTAVGAGALSSNTIGSNNIALGASAGGNLTTGGNNIEIGNAGVAGDSKIIRIGTLGAQSATFVSGISGTAVTGTAVVVSSSGQLGVAPSSQRFKDQVKSMNEVSEAILALKPVTFRYKPELDPTGIAQFGLVAEEVEKVNPALVVRDADGKPYSVRYEAVNAMLLNEFLKEHQTVQDLKTTVAQLQKQIEVLAAGLQKVSAQLEVSKPQAQVASNRK